MDTGKRTHRRDRVVRRFMLLLIGLLLLAVLAPSIVGSTSMRQWALDQAVPDSVGKLTASGARFSWWAPVELSGVRLTDPAGTVVFQAASVRVERTLAQLALNSQDLGTIRVERPMVALFVRPDGSNLEDLVALLQTNSQAAAPPQVAASSSGTTPLQIEIASGAVQIVEAHGLQRSWVVDEITARIDTTSAIPSVAATAIVYEGVLDNASAPLRQAGQVSPPRPSGSLQIENTAEGTAQRLALTVNRLPLTPLEPWLARFDPSLKLAGTVTGSGGVDWQTTTLPPNTDRVTALLQSGLVTSGTLNANNLAIKSVALGDQPMRLARAQAPWRIRTAADGRLAVEQLDLESELGDAKLRAMFDHTEISALLAGDWSAPRTVSLTGDLDIAKLARVAPSVVRLRPGTAIQAGRVEMTLHSSPLEAPPFARITGSINTTDLTAVTAGRVIEWNRPLVVRAEGTRAGRELRLDKLVCQSEFLDINGGQVSLAGGGNQINAKLKFDLDRLTRQLVRFVDMQGWRLAGKGNANITMQTPQTGKFDGTASIDLSNLTLATPQQTLLNEQRLVGTLAAAGGYDASFQPTRIDAAKIDITAGGDRLDVRTTGPVAADGAAPMTMKLTGQLGNWWGRLRLVAPEATAGVERLAGSGVVSATGVVGAERFEFSQLSLKADNFELDAGDLQIREQQVQASGSLAYNPSAGRLAASKLELVTRSAWARGRDVALAWGGGSPATSSGQVVGQANLEQLRGWFKSQRLADAVQPSGVVSGDIKFAEQQGRLVATLDITGERIALQQANQVLWQSPTAKIRGQAAYAPNIDQMTFRNLSIEAATLRGSATGQIDRVQTDAEVMLNGVVDYDLQQWAPVIAANLGQGFTISGKDQAMFQLSGKLNSPDDIHWSQQLTGRVEAPWSSAVAYGVPVGAGRIGLALSQGVVRADPLVAALGGGVSAATTGNETGRLTIQPAVRLNPAPTMFGLPAGPVLTGVRITPEISEEMLKYVAPVLQGATRSEGIFSLTTDGVQAPLADLSQMQVSGQLAVQSVRVVPGEKTAGWVSMGREIEAIAAGGDIPALLGGRQPASQTTLLTMEDRTIGYRVSGGRVYHEAMPFRVGNVTMLSSGSVGFDETLDLELTVPIQDRWVEGKPLLVSLRGQSLKIPVRGTFDRPRVDRSAVSNLTRQIGSEAVRGAVGNEFGRALDKLFGN